MVDTSAAVRRGHPAAFIFLAITSFIAAVIASTITNDYNMDGKQTSHLTGSVRFMVFVGWWTFVFSIVYAVLFLRGIGGVVTSIAGHGIWIFLTWLFFLAGSAAVTDAMNGGGKNCGSSGLRYCNSLNALIAFGWISTIILTFMLVVVGIIGGGAFRGGRSVKESLA